MILLVKYTLLYSMVLMLVALGGMLSERSGIINIALEGIMTIGAVVGLIIVGSCYGKIPDYLLVMVTVLGSALAGGIYSLLLGFACINLKADQTIGGTALNLMATGIAVILAQLYNGRSAPQIAFRNDAFIFNIGGITVNVFFFIGIALLIVAAVLLFKTKFGLRLMACGEHPQAADSVGINVYKMRYAGVIMSGIFGGIGGLAYILPTVSSWNFEYGIAGMGFLALAVMIFGNWKPVRIFFAALFFAVFKSLANIYKDTFLASWGLSAQIYEMMPYIASMIILALTSKKSRAPKAEGVPYDKGLR